MWDAVFGCTVGPAPTASMCPSGRDPVARAFPTGWPRFWRQSSRAPCGPSCIGCGAKAWETRPAFAAIRYDERLRLEYRRSGRRSGATPRPASGRRFPERIGSWSGWVTCQIPAPASRGSTFLAFTPRIFAARVGVRFPSSRFRRTSGNRAVPRQCRRSS